MALLSWSRPPDPLCLCLPVFYYTVCVCLSCLCLLALSLYVSHRHILKYSICYVSVFSPYLSLFVSTVSVSYFWLCLCGSCLCLLTRFSPRLSCLRLLHLFNCVLHVYSLVSHISDSSRARSIYIYALPVSHTPCYSMSLLLTLLYLTLLSLSLSLLVAPVSYF